MTSREGPSMGGRRSILWLSHFLPWPPKGGLMQRSYHLMKEIGHHHDLRVVAFRQRAHQPDEVRTQEAVSALSSFARVVHVLDLPEDRIIGRRATLALRSLFPGPPYTIRWGTSDLYALAVEAAMRDARPDVVHFDTVSLSPYLKAIGPIPAVLNHHNIESHMLMRRSEKETNMLKKYYFAQEGRRLAQYEKKVAKSYRLHLVCADLDAKRLVKTVGDVPTLEVPNGADLAYFHPASPERHEEPDSMVFVGGLSWYPNASAVRFFASEIWPVISARRPAATVRIIGRNPPADLRRLATEDSRFIVMGFVDDIRPWVHESMVYVAPVFDGGGTKLKMIDAMAMGKAIVAHPVAAEGLGLQHGRDVLLSEDPLEMAEMCIRLFENGDARRRMGRAARLRAEEAFGFGAIGEKLALAYRQLA